MITGSYIDRSSMSNNTVVVVGGGIAGTSCIEALIQDYNVDNPGFNRLVLISENKLVKRVVNYELTGRQLERFDVIETDINQLDLNIPECLQFTAIIGSVVQVDYEQKNLIYIQPRVSQSASLSFDILCICTGSKPRLLNYFGQGSIPEVDERVIVIRDTTSVKRLESKLRKCKRCVIAGNGGISLELVSKVTGCEKIWILRDESIGYNFFDSGAAKFYLNSMKHKRNDVEPDKRECYSATTFETGDCGPSLGPGWAHGSKFIGSSLEEQNLEIVYQDEVKDIVHLAGGDYMIKVLTKNNKQFDCDLVMSAIGVDPNKLSVIGAELELSSIDGGILVDEQMRTSLEGVYACGDVISCDKWPKNELWFQMRLWTQARQMGFYAGRCIAAHIRQEDPTIYFNFDCFTHCTSFFDHKLVLLGRYNGQSLTSEDKFEVLVRVNDYKDYVKVLIRDDGQIIGAVLVGDSGLEETIENLMRDGIDVSNFKENLLDDTVDIEDFFD